MFLMNAVRSILTLTCADRGRGTHTVRSANISPARDAATAASRPHHTHRHQNAIAPAPLWTVDTLLGAGKVSTSLRTPIHFTCAHVNNLMGVAEQVFLLRNMPSSRAALNTSLPCAIQCILHFPQTTIHFAYAHVNNALCVAPATPHSHI
jgi:hypothetical protein